MVLLLFVVLAGGLLVHAFRSLLGEEAQGQARPPWRRRRGGGGGRGALWGAGGEAGPRRSAQDGELGAGGEAHSLGEEDGDVEQVELGIIGDRHHHHKEEEEARRPEEEGEEDEDSVGVLVEV